MLKTSGERAAQHRANAQAGPQTSNGPASFIQTFLPLRRAPLRAAPPGFLSSIAAERSLKSPPTEQLLLGRPQKMTRTLLTALLAAALGLGTALGAQAGEKLAEQHVKMSMKCETCHGPDMKNPETPSMETCTGCHNVDQLVEKTNGVKPVNPHVSPHYQTEP